LRIFVDADACPVKDEILRVATRHQLPVLMVSNSWMRLPASPLIERVIVAEGSDAADDWIVERIGAGDICVTQDIPLASRCVKAGARAIGPTGKAYDEGNMGMALAMRDLMKDLREVGAVSGHNSEFTKADRSRLLQTLEQVIQELKRSVGQPAPPVVKA